MVTTKTFRVFISSTFSDMAHERSYLQKEVFPRLRELCKQNGAKFQAIDLRWGVNKETQQDQKTMRLCLKEIDRCQRISPKPNFVVLVGNRYGWQPIPDIIPEKEMKEIITKVPLNDLMLIEQWYKEDTNAIPSEFVLQPRGDEYKEYSVWEKVESKLRLILRSAVVLLDFTKEQQIKYFTSATHQEIIRGALLPEDAKKHVFSYFRTITNLPFNEASAGFTDILEGKKDDYAAEMLSELKEELQHKLDESNIYQYSAQWLPDKKNISINEIEAFGNRVYDNLKDIIINDLQESKSPSEIEAHQDVKADLLKGFLGREETIESIFQYLDSKEQESFFCLTGPSGSGKSSVMAKVIDEAEKKSGATIIYRFAGTTTGSSDILPLFMGVNEQLAGVLELNLQDLSEKIRADQNVTDEALIQSKIFNYLIVKAGENEKTLCIFIDSLDQVNNIANIKLRDWIPEKLFSKIKIIFSIQEQYKEKVKDGLIHELPLLTSDVAGKILKGWFSIPSISRTLNEAQFSSIIKGFIQTGLPLFLKISFELAKDWRSFDRKSISAKSIDDLLTVYFEKIESDHCTEIVKTALGYLLAGKYGLSEDEILDLFVFDNQKQKTAHQYDGQAFWEFYLDNLVFERSYRLEIEQMGKFPVIVWSRLLLDLLPFLSERDIPGGRTFVFFHKIMAEFARNRYYEPSRDRWHNNLADYFEDDNKNPLLIDKVNPNIRRVVEQPYQETLSGQWDDLYAKTLGNYGFVEAKIKANMLNEILADYEFAEQNDVGKELNSNFRFWKSFIQSSMHTLLKGNEKWPAFKILLQLAMEHADNSPVTMAAEEYLKNDNVNWHWMRRMQRPKSEQGSTFVPILGDHTQAIKGVKLLSNKTFITWSDDTTLKIWDKEGKSMVTLEGHKGPVIDAFELSNDRILSLSVDHTIRIWKLDKTLPDLIIKTNASKVYIDNEERIFTWNEAPDQKEIDILDDAGKIINKLKCKFDYISDVRQISTGQVIVWGEGKKAEVWDRSGNNPVILSGHSAPITGMIEFTKNQLVSWANDETVKIWDLANNISYSYILEKSSPVKGVICLDNKKIAVGFEDGTISIIDSKAKLLSRLNEHNRWVDGLCKLTGSRFLSFSDDHKICIWSNKGKLIKKLEGHKDYIKKVFELQDGTIVSVGADNVIYLWESKGESKFFIIGNPIEHCFELDADHIVVASKNNLVQILNVKGMQSISRGHNYPVIGITDLDNGNIITWDDEDNFIVWSSDGEIIKTHEPQKSKVYLTNSDRSNIPLKIIALDNSSFIYYPEKDSKAYLYDSECKIVLTFEGIPPLSFLKEFYVFVGGGFDTDLYVFSNGLEFYAWNEIGERQLNLNEKYLTWIKELREIEFPYNLYKRNVIFSIWKNMFRSSYYINQENMFNRSDLYEYRNFKYLNDKYNINLDKDFDFKIQEMQDHFNKREGMKIETCYLVSSDHRGMTVDDMLQKEYITRHEVDLTDLSGVPLHWHSPEGCKDILLPTSNSDRKKNNNVIVTRQDGQVCFLKVFKGKTEIKLGNFFKFE